MTAVLTTLELPPLPEALPVPVIDSHTHLDATEQHSGLTPDDALRLARSVGVAKVVQVGCDVSSSVWSVQIAQRCEDVVAAIAIHPNDAARLVENSGAEALDAALAEIGALAAKPGVRAIGETGLDFFRTRHKSGQETQMRSFMAHIELAVRNDLTLVIHDRDAHEDILRLLDFGVRPERVVFHCFSGDKDFALECVARDAWLSFPGVVTFKSAGELRQALQVTPLDKLLVESDAPFLTPMPYRGRSNASYLVPNTVRFIAAELDIEVEELCRRIAANTAAAFGGEWGA